MQHIRTSLRHFWAGRHCAARVQGYLDLFPLEAGVRFCNLCQDCKDPRILPLPSTELAAADSVFEACSSFHLSPLNVHSCSCLACHCVLPLHFVFALAVSTSSFPAVCPSTCGSYFPQLGFQQYPSNFTVMSCFSISLPLTLGLLAVLAFSFSFVLSLCLCFPRPGRHLCMGERPSWLAGNR